MGFPALGLGGGFLGRPSSGGGASLKSSQVQASDAADLTVSGLDGDTDGEYFVEGRLILISANAQNVILGFNGLTTNQFGRYEAAGAAATSVSNIQLLNISSSFTGSSGTPLAFDFHAWINCRKTVNGVTIRRTVNGLGVIQSTLAGSEVYPFRFVGMWNETSANITSLLFRNSVALGIKAGSEVRVWKPSSTFGA